MSPSNAAASGLWRTLLPVFAACAAIGLQAGVALPLVPLTLDREGADNFTIGMVSAAWALGMLSFGPRIPQMAARFGAAPCIVVSVVLGSLIIAAYTVTSGPVVWAVLSFLHGAIGGVPWVVSEIWMNVVVEEKRRGRVMATYATMFAAGMALGPFVLQIVGVYGPRPFLVCAAIAPLVAIPLLPFWKTSPRIAHPDDSGFALVIAAAPLAMFAAFASGTGEQVAFSFLPVYAVDAGVSAETGALWLSAFVIGNIILQWPIGWVADHVDRRAVLAICALLSMGLMLLLPLVSVRSAGIIAVVMLWGGISFSIYPVGLALLGRKFNGGDMARANTAYSLLYILGGLIGRPLTGAAMDAVGKPGLGWTLAVFYAAVGFAALLALRRSG